MTAALAFAAAAAASCALLQFAASAGWRARMLSGRGAEELAAALDSLLMLGREGREPGALERRRLLVAGAALAFVTGSLLLGPAVGAAVALAAPAGVARLLHARRAAYRRALAREAGPVALALADALSGGHSLRGALAEAARGLGGAGGAELRRVAAGLEAGERTDAALEGLRARAGSHAIDAVVAACLLQQRSGGDLGGLLRRLARAFEDEQRLEDEARAATAQARFTGLLVTLLPAGGALLAELAAPGFAAGIARSPLALWLVAVALGLQLAAAGLIRRLGRAST